MIRKLIIVAYYGPWPSWIDQYLERARGRGFDWLVHYDLADFADRCRRILGVDCQVVEGGSKIHDYRPMLGRLFADELAGYDWWAHTDVDCVYGRLGVFYSGERLEGVDIASDHTHYICGPWTMYRNFAEVNDAFELVSDWREIVHEPSVTGWVETSFTAALNDALGSRVHYELLHGYENPSTLRAVGQELYQDGREIPFFHFRRTKEWPLL